MRMKPFLLDQWLEQKFSADPPIEFDLGSSTGPVWTVRELLALEGGNIAERLLDTAVSYTSTAGTRELREAIAEMSAVDPETVQIVTGGSEALLTLFCLAAEPGANVVLSEPGFPIYSALAESLGITVRRYHVRAESHFAVDPDEVRALVDRDTRVVLVNSPHNPTGSVIPADTMRALHDFCADRGVPFVSDEVYHPIYHGAAVPSAATLPHATVLGDFSKALCLSGLRIGWIVERDAARREAFLNARRHFTLSSTALGERMAALAVRHRDAIYGRAQRIATANLALLDEFFTAHQDTFDWVRPAGGMTAFPRLKDGSDGREFCRRAVQQGVLLAPGDCFGMKDYFRLGFAASGEKFASAMERLEAIVGRAMAQSRH
jgi:aspartate/methionine/tyrosine aminotransferase